MPTPRRIRRPLRSAGVLLAFACLLASHRTLAADDTWVEVKSPHFVVISNAGEKRARNMAWQFEQVQALLRRLWPWANGSFERPLFIYAVKDERSMRTLAPEYWERRGGVQPASVFVTAPDAHYISVRTDVRADGVDVNPYRSSYWSYVALTLNSSIPHELPLWYYRGLAELFSNIIRDKDVQIGLVLPWHLERLRDRPPLRLDELFGATRQSPHMTDGDRMAHFDASAWALMHYLTFGNEGKNLARLNELSTVVASGANATDALAKAYGGLPAVDEGYHRYVSKMLYMYQRAQLDVNVDQAAFATRPLSAPEANVALARYYAATGRPVESHARLAAALQASPQSGAAFEVEGVLLDREDKDAEALAAFTRAAEMGGASYYGEFRYAQLSWPDAPDTKEPFPKMEKSLRRSIELRPSFSRAHALLANVLLKLDRAPESVPVAQRAVALDAFASYPQLTLARALLSTGKQEEAMVSAQRARTLAKSAVDKNAAEQFITLLRSKTR